MAATNITLETEVELGPDTLTVLLLIANNIARVADAFEVLTFRKPTSLKLNLPGTDGGTMPFSYKADKVDFDAFVTLQGVDSEGNSLPNINIPTGQTLTVVSSDPLGLTATQDPLNPKRVTYHVGEPNTDESPRPVTVTATLTRDIDGSTVLVISDTGEVTVGDAVGDPVGGSLGLPTS